MYFSISGTLCSVSGLADMFGTVIDTAESRQFIASASCRLLAYHATLHSHRMLCWFLIPENIGFGLNSLLYLPPLSVSGNFSVAAKEEYERGEYSLCESQLTSLNSSSNHADPDKYCITVAAASRFLRREMARASSLSPSPGECPSEEAVQALIMTSVRRALSRIMQALDSSSLVQALDFYSSVPIPGSDPQNTTDEVNFDQMNAVPDYSLVVIIPSVQQHRLLSLLEQGLSILTPNNPTSASFAHYGVIPFSLPYSQSWKMAYEHESLCKLHTAYDYPGRIGKEGRCFYKLANYIADLCI